MIVNEKEGKVYLTPQEVVDYGVSPVPCKRRSDVYFAIKYNFLKAKKNEKGYLVEFELDDEIKQKINSDSTKKTTKRTTIAVNFQLYKALFANADKRGMSLGQYLDSILENVDKDMDFFVMESSSQKGGKRYHININTAIANSIETKLKKILKKRKRSNDLIIMLTIMAIWQSIELVQQEQKQLNFTKN